MKRFVSLLILLFVSVWLGLQIARDPGYALFAYRQWTVEMPLWLATISLVIAIWLIYQMFRLIGGVSHLGQRWRAWRVRRRLRRSRNLTQQGLVDLAEGDWHAAEKELLKAVTDSEIPLVNYLGAAFAAQQQYAAGRRNDYLQLAKTAATPDTQLGLSIMCAWLALQAQQYEDAALLVEELKDQAPEQVQVIRLLHQLYLRQQNWQGLVDLLPALRQHGILHAEEYVIFAQRVYREFLLQAAAIGGNTELIRDYWRRLPKQWQQDSTLLQVYVGYLKQQNAVAEALHLLHKQLKVRWDERLIYEYGLLSDVDIIRQLEQAEAWLPHHQDSAMLLLTLGRLARRNQLWGKARSYLEASLALEQRVETYQELGELLLQLNETAAALNCFQKGLISATLLLPAD